MSKCLPAVTGALGIFGSLTCSVAMVMALVGLLGAGVATTAASTRDMAGMAGTFSTLAPMPNNSALPSPLLTSLSRPILGGLHHAYERAA